jgi:hypothetical protein
MTDFALPLWYATAPKLDLGECETVLAGLQRLGYRIVAKGSPGDHVGFGEWKNVAIAISKSAPIGWREALIALTSFDRLEYSIQKPSKLENAKQ